MFIVDPNPSFTHKVTVQVPVDGGFEEQSFKATFAVIPAEEAASYDLSDGKSTSEFLRRIVTGMDELVDKDDKPVPYNDALRDKLLGLPFMRMALSRAYFGGVAGARSGN